MKHFFFFFLFSFLTACSAVTLLSENDSRKTFFVHVGDKQVISLPENPSTGYSWQFFIASGNRKIVSDIKETYIAPDTRMAGTGGIKEYSFTAREKGEITITGYYVRPWEKLNKQTADKVTYTFNIAD